MKFKTALIIVICVCAFNSCKSQFNPDTSVDKKVITLSSDSISQPLPKDGETALKEYIKKKVVTPEIVYKDKIEGEIFLSLKIDTVGNIIDIRLTRTLTNCTPCEVEAIRIAKELPRFIPAYQMVNGQKKLIQADYWIKIPFKYN